MRVSYSLFAQKRGKELEEFKELTQMMPMGFGDDLLRFNGIGERVTFGMYNNDAPTEADKEQLYAAAKWAAERGMSLTQHWQNAKLGGHLLDVFERVNREIPIAPLRWSIAHLNDASDANLARMKALGVGWTMQNAMYFEGERFAEQRGEEVGRRAPPVMSALKIGVPTGAGTDAHRVMSYNPFVALQWLLDGKTVGGTALRGPEQIPTREQALRMYTSGSAWFDHSRAAARLARSRQARRPRGAVEGLPEGAGGRDRRHRVAADDGRRKDRLRRRTLRKARQNSCG